MDLQDLLLAYAISQGSHTAGHFQSANSLNVPISLDAKNLAEVWDTPDKRKDAEINAGGFANQDAVRRALEGTSTQGNVSLTNALMKAAYLAGLPNKLSPQLIPGGDIGGMERSSGNKYTKHLLGASALIDLYKSKNPKSNWDVSFIAPEGAPGLLGTWRW